MRLSNEFHSFTPNTEIHTCFSGDLCNLPRLSWLPLKACGRFVEVVQCHWTVDSFVKDQDFPRESKGCDFMLVLECLVLVPLSAPLIEHYKLTFRNGVHYYELTHAFQPTQQFQGSPFMSYTLLKSSTKKMYFPLYIQSLRNLSQGLMWY